MNNPTPQELVRLACELKSAGWISGEISEAMRKTLSIIREAEKLMEPETFEAKSFGDLLECLTGETKVKKENALREYFTWKNSLRMPKRDVNKEIEGLRNRWFGPNEWWHLMENLDEWKRAKLSLAAKKGWRKNKRRKKPIDTQTRRNDMAVTSKKHRAA